MFVALPRILHLIKYKGYPLKVGTDITFLRHFITLKLKLKLKLGNLRYFYDFPKPFTEIPLIQIIFCRL